MKILVTGAAGFIGRNLCQHLSTRYTLRMAVRKPLHAKDPLHQIGETYVIGEISGQTDWTGALQGIEVVVHLANRAHVMHETSKDALGLYRAINLEGTRCLAAHCIKSGIQRLVFVSTLKVLGERSHGILQETSPAMPQDPYSQSKWEAEQALKEISINSALQSVIVRLPLVYGPGVGANFLQLIKTLDKGIPLPFAGSRNKRSLLYVGNFNSAVQTILNAPPATITGSTRHITYHICDPQPVCTAELIRAISNSLGQQDRSFRIPAKVFQWARKLHYLDQKLGRLLDSLQTSNELIHQELGWTAPYSVGQGVAQTVQAYVLSQQQNWQQTQRGGNANL